jgi:hypothetical protein
MIILESIELIANPSPTSSIDYYPPYITVLFIVMTELDI